MADFEETTGIGDYVDCIPVAFAVFDPAYRVVVANSDGRSLFGALGAALASGETLERAVDRGFRAAVSAVDADMAEITLEGIIRALMEAQPFDLCAPDRRVLSVSVTRPAAGGMMAVGQDVTALRLGQGAGAQADAVIRGSGAARSMVLSAFAERIRTPIAQLSRTARVLRDQAEPWARDPQIDTMMAHCRALAVIAQEASALVGGTAETLQVLPTEGGFRAKVSRVAEVYAPAARERGSCIDVTFGKGVPDKVLFDPIRLRQCLSTLLAHAVDRTSGGVISVTASGDVAHDGHLVLMLDVRDSGGPLGEDDLATLFAPGLPLDQQASRDGDARTGVKLPNLALVHTLTALMGGDLTASSTAGGLSIWMSLRSVQVADGAPTATPIAPLPRTQPSAPSASPHRARDRRVLVLEPADARLDDIQRRLSSSGAIVFGARNGLEARRMTYAHKPHMFSVDPRRFKLDVKDLKPWLARYDLSLGRLAVSPMPEGGRTHSSPMMLATVTHPERLLDLSDIGRLLTIYRFEDTATRADVLRRAGR